MAEGITLAEQADIAKKFLTGLLEAMELTAEVSVREIDAETVELAINANPASELGILVGPRGTTLQALQEVTRTVVQAKSPGRTTVSWSMSRSTASVASRPWPDSASRLP